MDSIRFPNLGIVLSHVGSSFSILGFEIAYYGAVIAIAMVAGVCLVLHVAKKTGQDPDMYLDFSILTLVVAVIGARIYYVAFSWDYYRAHPAEIINLRAGGLAIYGGVIAGIIMACVWSRVKKIPTFLLLDTVVPGVVLGQIIGRWGNFFNREAFGDYTNNLLAMQIPEGRVHPGEITAKMREMIEVIDGVSFIQVHPTFLYESLWNLGVLILLLLIIRSGKKRFDGEIFWLYLMGYSSGRFWIENLRTDQLLVPGTAVPVSRLLALCAVIAAFTALTVGFYHHPGRDKERR